MSSVDERLELLIQELIRRHDKREAEAKQPTKCQPFRATVIDSGGGHVLLSVDRDTERYPDVGAHVDVSLVASQACSVCGTDPAEGAAFVGYMRTCHGDGPGPSCYEVAQRTKRADWIVPWPEEER